MRVLVVDDSASTLTIISHFIEKIDGFQVVGHTDPVELVDQLDQMEFDIALVDYVMPGLDGPQVMRKIRAHRKFQNVPILVMTANTDRETRLKSLSNGAIDFINKPVEPIEFTTRMKNIGQLRAAQLMLEDKARLLNCEVERQTRKLLEREQDIVDIVTKTAGFRDNDIGRHSLRVGKYSAVIAEQLGLDTVFCKDIGVAAQLHDIGKVAISDAVLKKSTKFTPADVEEMKNHTRVGHEILAGSKSPVLVMAATIAQFHHEKWDGSGYPSGRAHKDIPIEARIAAVADCFDALATARRYKEPWPVEEIAAYLDEQAGCAFDPDVVQAFAQAMPKVRQIMATYSDQPTDTAAVVQPTNAAA